MSTEPVAAAAAAAANENGNIEDQNKEKTWRKSDKEFLLVVVTFMATVAFQAGINPPGGVWQDSKDPRAGKSIMATQQPSLFTAYIVSTTACMAFSLLQVLVMLNELPYNRLSVSRNFLFVSCGFAIGSMALAYWLAVTALTPESMLQKVTITLISNIVVSGSLLLILVYIQKRRPNALDC